MNQILIMRRRQYGIASKNDENTKVVSRDRNGRLTVLRLYAALYIWTLQPATCPTTPMLDRGLILMLWLLFCGGVVFSCMLEPWTLARF